MVVRDWLSPNSKSFLFHFLWFFIIYISAYITATAITKSVSEWERAAREIVCMDVVVTPHAAAPVTVGGGLVISPSLPPLQTVTCKAVAGKRPGLSPHSRCTIHTLTCTARHSALTYTYSSGSSLSSYTSGPTSLKLVQAEIWNLTHAMPNRTRQDAPHPHEAVTDPTGQYILVPDLGADLVRIFLVNQTSLQWTPVTPLTAAPGSGPRHVAFLVTNNRTFMYLTSELVNTVTGYEVTYNKNNTLGFSQVYISSTFGLNNTVPSSATAAEILVTVSNE